jgi:DNA-binding HxlR family transcriptional regulator
MESRKTKIDKDCCNMKSVDGHCPKPLEEVSSYLSKKWNVSIIITIGNFGKLRFNDLLGRLEGAGAKILSEKLKELEREGIIRRKVFSEAPLKVEYSLTKNGNGLLRALEPLISWAEKN